MEKYNYFEAVREDIRDYIVNNYTTEEIRDGLADRDSWSEKLNDDLWTCDAVTGNGSGSYTFNAWTAEENLCHNMDLLAEALETFGCGPEYMEKGPEACDVTIRCYLLSGALSDVLEDLEEDPEYTPTEEEEDDDE